MRIPKVALVWRSKVDLRLIEWVLNFIWEDASREARDDFVCLVGIGRSEDVIVYQSVVTEERELLLRHIRDITSEITRGMIKPCLVRTLYFMFLNRPPTGVPVHRHILPSTTRSIRLTKGSQVNHVRRFVLVEEGIRRNGVPAHAQI